MTDIYEKTSGVLIAEISAFGWLPNDVSRYLRKTFPSYSGCDGCRYYRVSSVCSNCKRDCEDHYETIGGA